MPTIPAIVLTALMSGAAMLAATGASEARFGAGAIAAAAGELRHVELAQHRQRARPAPQRPRASATPVTTIESTYRDPTTRGALLGCSFC